MRRKSLIPPLEELGQEVRHLIEDDGFTLSEAAKFLGEKYQCTPTNIRGYWNNYAQFHRIEYDHKQKKILAYDEIS